MKRRLFFQLVVGLVAVIVSSSSFAGSSERVVLVSLFENLSKEKAIIKYAAESTASLDFRSKQFSVDRYSEIPRTLLEDALINMSVKVVERQSLHKMLVEHKFISDSGLVDTTTAIKVAKMLGANALIVGTITDIRKKKKKFKGYGISTSTISVETKIRARVIDLESGQAVFERTPTGVPP